MGDVVVRESCQVVPKAEKLAKLPAPVEEGRTDLKTLLAQEEQPVLVSRCSF